MESSLTVSVRKAEASDLGVLVEVLSQLHPLDPPLDSRSDSIQSAWEEMQRQPHRALLVAEVAGRVVGTIDWYLTPNLTHGGRPYGTIENFVVDSSHRRRGVGTRHGRGRGCPVGSPPLGRRRAAARSGKVRS